MFIPESNKIPEEFEISMDLRTLLQFYQAPESMLAEILLIDEETVKRAETQRNDQITDDLLSCRSEVPSLPLRLSSCIP